MNTVVDLNDYRGAPVLDPQDPMAIARGLIDAKFTDQQQNRLLHRHDSAFWRFVGNCYREFGDEELRAVIWTYLELAQRLDKTNNVVPFKPSKNIVTAVVDATHAVCALDARLVQPAWISGSDNLPPAGEMLPVANGVLHLPTSTLLPPTPNYFVTGASTVAFDQNAKCKRWLDFLHEILGKDEEQIRLLQEWFGYLLTNDTSQEKILLIRGEARSGKGTIARVIRGILGGDRVGSPTLATLQETFGLQSLIGKVVAIVSDARLGGRSNSAVVIERLLSISGEDGISIPRKFKTAYDGRLPVKFMILTNLLLRLPDASGTFATRCLPLEFKRSFLGKEQHDLTERLLEQGSGILNWAITGYQRLTKRGHFLVPSSTAEMIEEMQRLGAPVKTFVEESCELDPKGVVTTEALYVAWKSWCFQNGGRSPGEKSVFSRSLRSAYPQVEISKTHDSTREFHGLRLLAKNL